MEVRATFIYHDRTINVQCSSEDEMSKLFESFINKLGIESKITDYIFIYNGNELDIILQLQKINIYAEKKK